MATLTIPQIKFQSRLHDRCSGDSSINREWPSAVEALNIVLGVARKLSPPADTDSTTLELICSSVVSELGKNRMLTAVVEMRTEEKEKRRLTTAAKKGAAGAELTGALDEDAVAALESTVTPADTTKTALRENGKGVHWVPENQEARAARIVPGTEEAKTVIIDDSGLRAEVTPWQEIPSLSDAPVVEPAAPMELTPAKEEVVGDKNPSEDVVPIESKPSAMADPFAEALVEAMDDAAAAEEQQALAPEPQASVATDAVMTEAIVPSSVPEDIEEVPSQPPKTPAPSKTAEDDEEPQQVADVIEDIEEVPSQPTKTQPPPPTLITTTEDNFVVPSTPPIPDAAPGAAATDVPPPSTPILPAAVGGGADEDEASEVFENEAGYAQLMTTLAFGISRAKESDATTRAALDLAWKEAENAVSKLEEDAVENDVFNYGIRKPVTNFFSDKINSAWLIHKLNVINFMTQKEALAATEEIQLHGAPVSFVQMFLAKKARARNSYLERVNQYMEDYLLKEPWKKSSSAAAKKADVFPPPRSRLDFLPKSWEERYCDPDTRNLWDLNEVRKEQGKAAWATVKEMTEDPDYPEMLKKLDEEREDADDEDFADDDEADDSDGGDDSKEEIALGDDSDDETKKARKQSRKKSAATKKSKKATEEDEAAPPAAAAESVKPSGSSKRKGSNPKRVLAVEPVPTEDKEEADNNTTTATAKKSKREGSPLPEMKPKLKFVAESVCERYDEVREKAQDGKPKYRETLLKAAENGGKPTSSSKRSKEADDSEKNKEEDADKKKKARKANDEDKEHSQSAKKSDTTTVHPKLAASFETIKATLPKKLQSNFTFEHLVEDTENLLMKRELKHKSVERVFKDAEEIATYHIALITAHLHDLSERKRLKETLTSPTMRPWTHESGKVPNVCSLTGRRIMDKAKLSYVHKDEHTTMEEAVRVDASYVPHLVAINFLSVGFKAFDLSGAGGKREQELPRHASMLVMALRLLISNTPDRPSK